MNFLNQFEQEGLGGRRFETLTKLELNTEYRVDQFRFIDTTYGRRIAVDLENLVWTILPKRLSDLVGSQNELDALNRKKYSMIYKGRENTNRLPRILVEFKRDTCSNDFELDE